MTKNMMLANTVCHNASAPCACMYRSVLYCVPAKRTASFWQCRNPEHIATPCTQSCLTRSQSVICLVYTHQDRQQQLTTFLRSFSPNQDTQATKLLPSTCDVTWIGSLLHCPMQLFVLCQYLRKGVTKLSLHKVYLTATLLQWHPMSAFCVVRKSRLQERPCRCSFCSLLAFATVTILTSVICAL